jgi:hypothetical protein
LVRSTPPERATTRRTTAVFTEERRLMMPFGSGMSRRQSYRSVSGYAHTALPAAPPGRLRGEAYVSANRRDVPPTPENSYEARTED